MLVELLESVFGTIGLNIGQAGLVAGLLASALYWRKALGAASVASDWGGRLVFSAVVLAVLRLSGVIEAIDVGRAIDIAMTVVNIVMKIVKFVF